MRKRTSFIYLGGFITLLVVSVVFVYSEPPAKKPVMAMTGASAAGQEEPPADSLTYQLYLPVVNQDQQATVGVEEELADLDTIRFEDSVTEAADLNGAASAERTQAQQILKNTRDMLNEGRRTFRFDTFGDEIFWGDTLQLHQAIQGEAFGGVGPGLSPNAALAVGLKVDAARLPNALVKQLQQDEVNLDDPATTLALLRLNAVVGVKGFFQDDDDGDDHGNGALRSVGITCALCHSTVNDALAPGIGRRLDGWANRDLNVGAIISLAPDLSAFTTLLEVDEATVKEVLAAWGPGKFDAELILDGKGFRPDGQSAATLIPPAFGLAGVNLHTWTGGWGTVTYWNAFVANLEMQGQGTFFDARLNNADQFPVAARAGFGNKRSTPDLITPKLAALHFYQLAIPAPPPPAGSFDPEAAARGEVIFNAKARCAECHVPPLYTEPGWNTHKAAEIGIDDFQANRSPDQSYRTAPLKGLWTHQKGGFYHDGRFATLLDVVAHYDQFFSLGLTDQEQNDLVEFLKSL
jgi:hypothetical protein